MVRGWVGERVAGVMLYESHTSAVNVRPAVDHGYKTWTPSPGSSCHVYVHDRTCYENEIGVGQIKVNNDVLARISRLAGYVSSLETNLIRGKLQNIE